MSQTVESYTPSGLRERFRAQAIRVWIVAGAVVLAWVMTIVAGPLLTDTAAGLPSDIYNFFSYVCHQIPERSFAVSGHPLAVCTRCFGVYLGLLAGVLVYPLWRPIEETEPISRFWLFLSLIPITIDWSLSVFGVWENTHLSRFLTGMILGVACATFIVPAVVEIRRNITSRRHLKQKAAGQGGFTSN